MAKLSRSRKPAAPRFSLAAEDWLGAVKAARRSPATLRTYRDSLRVWTTLFDDPQLDAITTADVRRALVTLEEAHTATTCLTRYSALRTFLSWCVNEGYLAASPLARVQPPPLPETAPPGFSDDEIRRLLAVCNPRTAMGARNRALILTLFGTGLRLAELLQLTRADVRDDNVIRIVGKGNRERLVTLLPAVREALGRYLLLRSEDGETALWLGEQGKLTPNGVRALLARVGRKAGIEGVHPHRFRRAALSAMLYAGLDPHATLQVSGHRTDRMLRHYVGHAEEKRAGEALLRADHVGKLLEAEKRPRGRPRKH